MTPRLPVLGVMVGTRTPTALRSLLVAASDRCRPVACSTLEPLPDPAPDAYLWCASSTRPPDRSTHAAWVAAPADLAHPLADTAAVLLCPVADLLDDVGERGVFVPTADGDSDARPVTPFVRRRLRRARGLPDVVIARGEDGRWYWGESTTALPPDLTGTAAGTAAAVVATGTALPTALAWAAPTVTDPDTAARLGATDGVHVLVGADPEERLALAHRLAGEDTLAARLGWSGRLLARDRVDVRHAAWTMLARLGLPDHPLSGRLSALEHELDALGTPAHSQVRLRARALVDPLPGRLPTDHHR